MVGDGGPLSATTRKPSARPCQLWTADLLLTIPLVSGVSLFSPLLYGDLIDNAMPDRDVARPDVLALAMTGLPMVNGAIGAWQRQPKAQIGEGIMCDLRQAPHAHLQRMSKCEPDLSGVLDLKGLTASQGTQATARGGWPSLVGLASIPDNPLRHAAAVARHRKLGLSLRDC